MDSVYYDGTGILQPQHVRNDVELLDVDTTSFGVNIEPAFGVRVNENLVLTLGVRYQWLHLKTEDYPALPKSGMDDHLAGAFISVLLVF